MGRVLLFSSDMCVHVRAGVCHMCVYLHAMQEGGSLHRHTIERWLHAVAGRVAQQLNNYMFCAILQESVLALEMVLHGHCTLAWCNVAWCNTDMHMAYAQSQPDARLFQHDDLLESYR